MESAADDTAAAAAGGSDAHPSNRNSATATRPVSIIGSACQALISTVQKISADVTNFVRRCRSSRADLAPVTRELSELLMVLQLLDDYDMQNALGSRRRPAIPDELQTHLRPVLTNCIGVVLRIDAVLRRHAEAEGASSPRWTVEGRNEVSELSKSLGVHRSLMGLVSDLIAVLVSRRKSRFRDDGGDQLQISQVLDELQVLGSSIRISYSNATLAREHFALQVHLGQIITYAEKLARTEVWEDAVKALDAAHDSSGPDLVIGREVRSSVPVPAPLRRNLSGEVGYDYDHDAVGDSTSGVAAIPNRGLENLLPMGPPPPSSSDANRPASMLFTPNRTPEPDASTDGRAPATGFFVMDGFLNSDHGNNATISPTQFASQEPQQFSRSASSRRRQMGSSASSRQTPSYRNSEENEPRPARPSVNGHLLNLNNSGYPPAPSPSHQERRPDRPSTSGLEVAIHNEKEVTADDCEEGGEISEEALAFAQVPVHVLGRLSVNLVGHVYTNSSPRGEGSDQASFIQSLSTIKTTEGDDADYEDIASNNGTNDTGSLRDGTLQFSQVDVSKLPPPSASQPSSASHVTSPPLSESHPLYKSSSLPASHRTTESTLTSSTQPSPSTRSNPQFVSSVRPPPTDSGSSNSNHGLREMQSLSTMDTQNFVIQKPLPKAPIVYIPKFPGPFIKKKAVVVGNFSCGKTCMITRMAKGHYPKGKTDKCSITETVRIAVDEEPMELSLWDIRGIDYDPTWLNDAHVALVCFSVNIGSTDSKGKHLGRWVAEVNRNCPGAAILLVGLKADIRFHARSVEKLRRSGKALVTPEQGEQFRENIGASRYLECSARTGDGVLEVLGETARVAMQINKDSRKKGQRPLSRIGKFFGLNGGSSGRKSEDHA